MSEARNPTNIVSGVYNYKGEDTAWLIMNLYKFGSLDKYIEQNSHIPVSFCNMYNELYGNCA